MIKFDVNKMHVKIVYLKSCTTSLGGSARIVNEAETTMNGKEVYQKTDIPMAVVRAFQLRHKISDYIKPVVTALVYYDNRVVAMERHPLGSIGTIEAEGLNGVSQWQPDCVQNLNKFIHPLVENGEWYFDGKFIYTFDGTIETNVMAGEKLSSNGAFRSVEVTTIQLSNLHDSENLQPAERTCLAYVTKGGQFAITPPIWKNICGIGSNALKHHDDTDDNKTYRFDEIDQHLSVNLAFALKAGKEVGTVFGHDAIEPLQLAELMINLQTVNLPSIAKAVKQTFNMGMSFTHAMAWLIGMTTRVDSVDSYMVLRSLLKYLTTKGIYRNSMFDPTRVFKTGQDMESVPNLSRDDALDDVNKLTPIEMIIRIRENAVVKNANGGSNANILGMSSAI